MTANLALIAHDRYKDALAHFVFERRSELSRFHLVATQGTGQLIRNRTGLRVDLLKPDSEGGAQVADLIVANEVQAVIFFRDPVAPGPHEPDFTSLLNVCDLREIVLATNPSSAEAVLYFLLNSPNRSAITARPWAYEVIGNN